jgi:hypothetical protein
VMGELLSESSYFNFVQTWKDGELLNIYPFPLYMDKDVLSKKKIRGKHLITVRNIVC